MEKTGICVEKFDEMHLEFLLTKMKGMILTKPESLVRILPWLLNCEEKNISLSPLLMRSLSDTLKKVGKPIGGADLQRLITWLDSKK
jgi:hypothetical protein